MATGGISGAHLNPAVTLSMAILKKCKWMQVPVYMIAQYLGAFVASAVLYGNYYKFMRYLSIETFYIKIIIWDNNAMMIFTFQ